MNKINWKLFEVGEIFTIITGALLKPSNLKSGLLPRITATSFNNGISTFTNEITHKNFRKYNNFISVSFLGDVFYQQNEVSLDMKIHGLKLKDRKLTKELAIYLIPLIKKFAQKYSYGNQLSSSVLARQKLLLPITESGSIYWEFMHNYIQDIEMKGINETLSFLNNESKKVYDFMEVSLSDVKWSVYTLEDIVEISSGVRLTKSNMKVGNRPFIGATEFNNGITNYVLNSNSSLDYNVLGINYNGSVCQGFYHPYEAIFSDDVKRLKFKNGINNEYTLKFLLTVIEKQRNKYQYGYKFNEKRMKKQKVVLPTTDDNSLDFKFMENYIKKLKFNSITKALNFLENN